MKWDPGWRVLPTPQNWINHPRFHCVGNEIHRFIKTRYNLLKVLELGLLIRCQRPEEFLELRLC